MESKGELLKNKLDTKLAVLAAKEKVKNLYTEINGFKVENRKLKAEISVDITETKCKHKIIIVRGIKYSEKENLHFTTKTSVVIC